MMIATDKPQSKGFTAEQQKYLTDVLTKLNLHRAFQGGGQKAEPETLFGTPLEDLCKEELAKYDTHPLDLWDKIVQFNDRNQIAEGIDQFMFRHFGIFNVEPNSPGYMCRLRLPSCKMRGDQLMMLGDLSEDVAGGYAHVTTRGNFQLREIAPNRVLDLFAGLYDMGLSCKGSGADSARNITASPTAGFDVSEVTDLHKYGVKLSHIILNNRDLNGLPRKFNISFDNAGSISCVSDTNDIGFVAVKVKENPLAVEPGIYCRILLGGITGHYDFARDTGIVCKPEDSPEIAEAMLRVYIEHADRTNRKKARLKYVLDEHGFDWFIARTQEKLDALGNGVQLMRLGQEYDAPRAEIKRQAHIGVHAQKQDGLNYVGIALEVGKMTPDQMRSIGKIAQKYGRNDIRLTVWQNLLVPHIGEADVEAVVAEIEAIGLSVNASSFAAGAIACTGKWACKFGGAYTKKDATNLVKYLETKFTLDQPINIHLTGCHHTCAQHYIGDIGMVGAATADGREGYNIVLGGGTDNDVGLAKDFCGPIAAEDINELVENMIAQYLQLREGSESFLSFTRRHDIEQLKSVLLMQ
jgi:ferredoxin-nitrite reductase